MKTASLDSLRNLRIIAFAVRNARHGLKLLGPCFKKNDATLLPLRALWGRVLAVTIQFQAL